MDAYTMLHEQLDKGNVDIVLAFCEGTVIDTEIEKHKNPRVLWERLPLLMQMSLIMWRLHNEAELFTSVPTQWCDVCKWAYGREGSHLQCRMLPKEQQQHMYGGIPLLRIADGVPEEFGRKAFESELEITVDLKDFADSPQEGNTPPPWWQKMFGGSMRREGEKAIRA